MNIVRNVFLVTTLISSFAFAQQASIVGHVTHHGKELGGVQVCAKPRSTYPYEPGGRCTYTRNKGEYRLNMIASNYYDVIVHGAGHYEQRTVFLPWNTALQVNFNY